MLVFAGMHSILLFVLGFILGTEGDQCITPYDEDGQCVYIKTCKSLMAIVGKPVVTDMDKYIIKAHGNACQYTKKQADVCCPISEIIPPETTTTKIYARQECVTPKGVPGICMASEDCIPISIIYRKDIQTEEDMQFLVDSECPTQNGLYCCPTVVYPETEVPTTTTTVNIQRCVTTKGKPGSCVAVLECRSLRELSVKSHRTYEETELLKQSICGTYNLTYKVCCSENEIEKDKDLLPTTEECGKTDAITYRIFGGAQTGIEEYPWTALLLYETKEENTDVIGCGGSLVNKYYVITAAHCKEKNGTSVVKVRLGDWDITEDEDCDGPRCEPATRTMEIPVHKITIHPSYNASNLDYDVALLRLTVRVDYTRFIKPICLPMDVSLRGKRYEGKSTTIVGWGSTDINTTYSSIKLKTTVHILKRGTQYIYGNDGKKLKVSKHKIYASGNGKDSCGGDSGGPLMIEEEVNENINWYLIGIISYGNLDNTCGTKESIGVYARVSSFLDWIKDTIRT